MAVLSAIQGIREEIASFLNEAEVDNTDAYTNWINQAVRDIQQSVPWLPNFQTSADRTLSSGTRVYTNLPTDFEKMNTITYPAGDVKLTFLSPEEFDALQPSATEGGTPSIFTIRGAGATGRIEFYPVPGGSYTLHYDYQFLPATFSAGSGQILSAIPVKYADLLVLYGVRRGLLRKGLYVESREINEQYETLKERMIQDLMEQTTAPKRIKSIREFNQNPQYSDPILNVFWGKTT